MYTITIEWVSGHVDIERDVTKKRIELLRKSPSVVKVDIEEVTR